ncbi:MAG: DUF5597 domain-containing protein [Bacteroidales bacterium]|nr:DUF5597 domain-containing protein [Bacteroidales bacterium]
MNRFLSIFVAAAAMIAAACTSNPAPEQPSAAGYQQPHLEKRGNVTQLIVKGEPFLALASELRNSSASSAAYMEPLWENLKAGGMNTVLAVVTWEQVEPVEGQFDFTVVDDLVKAAREHDLKLAILWFGSWKNGMSSYHPVWVKKDNAKYPPALTKEGKKLPILSTLGDATAAADGKAYAAMMKHLREIDAEEQTVIMIQMENEVGLHGYTRDYCPAANAAFAGQVPAELMKWLSDHKDTLLPETLDAWKKSNCKTSGTWEEVFGKGDRTDEIFMAWNYASYMNKVSAAGKAEYDLPTFVNAWIVQPEDKRPGNYPSGGPQAQNHDIWRAGAPAIDILSPDIYLADFPNILRMYSRSGNPVFIPESRAGQGGAANAAFAIGEMGAIGYSPFGLESGAVTPQNKTFAEFYHKAGCFSKEILAAQAEGRIHGTWVKALDPTRVKDEVVMGDYKIQFELVSSGRRNGGAPQRTGGTYAPDAQGYAIVVQDDADNFTFLGSNIRVVFQPREGTETVGLAKVVSGDFDADGNWVPGRWLNGDEIQLRYDILPAIEENYSGQGLDFGRPSPEFIKVQLYKY